MTTPYDSLMKAIAKLKTARGADSLAVILANEGVRDAVCGSPRLCALAQFFANETGFTCSVASHIRLMDKAERTVATHDLTPAMEKFMDKFDGGGYKFLGTRGAAAQI